MLKSSFRLDFKTKNEMTQKFQEMKTELSTFLSRLEKEANAFFIYKKQNKCDHPLNKVHHIL